MLSVATPRVAMVLGCLGMLGALVGRAAADPTVQIVDADPKTGVKFATLAENSTLRIPLEPDGDVAGFRVAVDDFASPNATQVKPTVTLNGASADHAIDLREKDRPILEVSASFPVAGEYKSHVVLFFSGKRASSVPLSVTRQKAEVTVQIEGLATATSTGFRDADAKVSFTVRETSGDRVALYPPVLDGIALKDGDKVRKQAHYQKILVDGVEQAATPSGPGAESFVLEPRATRQVVVQIQGIEEAGEYSGTLRLSNSKGTPVTKEVSALIKTSAWIAAFWIFAGVLASFLIRYYTKEQRPKLQALRELRYAEEDLAQVESDAAPLVAEAVPVFKWIGQQFSKIERSLRDGTAKDNASAKLSEMQAKIGVLPNWFNVGRQIDAVKPADIVTEQRAAWEGLVSSYFCTNGADPSPSGTLAKIPGEIAKAVIERIKGFEESAHDYWDAHPSFKTEIEQSVDPPLKCAVAFAGQHDWKDMNSAFREGRLAYIRILAKELGAFVETAQLPLGFEPSLWKTLSDEIAADVSLILQESDPEAATEAYGRANRKYHEAVIQNLKEFVEAWGKREPDKKEKLATASGCLERASSAAQKKDWETARTEYEKAKKEVEVVRAPIRASWGGVQVEATDQTVAGFMGTIAPAGAFVEETKLVPLVKERKRKTSEQISSLLERYDLLLNAALLAIACVVGIELLWANDPTWGGWKSDVTALLWGLGLHQMGGATADGLPAVAKKLQE